METVKLRLLIEGLSKVGKSWLASTGPKPLLFLDFEHRARWVPGGDQATFWDGIKSPLELAPSPSRMYIHDVTDLNAFAQAMSWLRSGQHPYKTIVLDSPMELRSKIMYTKFPNPEMADGKDIGMVNRLVEAVIKDLYNLSSMPGNKCDAVVLVNGTVMDDYTKKMKILGLGGISAMLPHWTDVVTYLDNGQGGRRLYLQADGDSDLNIGDGTNILLSKVGPVIPNPNVERIYQLLQPDVTPAQVGVEPTPIDATPPAVVVADTDTEEVEPPDDDD